MTAQGLRGREVRRYVATPRASRGEFPVAFCNGNPKKTRRLGGVALSHNSIIPAISYLRSTLIHANSDIGVRLAL
jgi:hypothetical protein